MKDDTYAFLKVVQANGTELPLFDQSSPDGTTTQFASFILQNVHEARMEKHQIVETFGAPYIYFFGEAPRFLDVQAVLVDSFDFNWYAEWWENYNQFLRGTRSVELGARTYLFYDDNVVEGYMLMAETQKLSDAPLQARLSFRLFLTNYSNVSFVGDPEYPVRASISVPPDASLTLADEFSGGQSSGIFQSFQDQFEAAVAQGQQALLQQGGFGSFSSLSSALAFGLNSAGVPSIESLLFNAQQDQQAQGVLTRQAPERGLIALNTDEFTGPAPQHNDPSTDTLPDQEEPTDFWKKVVGALALYGANVNSPSAFASLGIGPSFTQPGGFGVRSASGPAASFGVGSGTGLGGLNGGLGFVGGLVANPQLAVKPPTPADLINPAAGVLPAPGQSVFGNGVQIGGGIFSGTGMGGGIPGGVSTGTGVNGEPLTQFTGGTSFADPPGGFSLSVGSLGGGVSVGGAPSAFASVVVPGNLLPTPSTAISFFTDPTGNRSDTNQSGIRV